MEVDQGNLVNSIDGNIASPSKGSCGSLQLFTNPTSSTSVRVHGFCGIGIPTMSHIGHQLHSPFDLSQRIGNRMVALATNVTLVSFFSRPSAPNASS